MNITAPDDQLAVVARALVERVNNVNALHNVIYNLERSVATAVMNECRSQAMITRAFMRQIDWLDERYRRKYLPNDFNDTNMLCGQLYADVLVCMLENCSTDKPKACPDFMARAEEIDTRICAIQTWAKKRYEAAKARTIKAKMARWAFKCVCALNSALTKKQ